VGEEAKGLAQRKDSALEEITWSFLNSSCHNISGFPFLSFPNHIPAAWRFSSWEIFPCPMSFPFQFSQTPSEPLCAHPGLTETCLFAGHCLGACSCLKVEERPGEIQPDGSSKGDTDSVHRQRSG